MTQELLEQFEQEHRFRKNIGKWTLVIAFLGIALTLFHLYTALFGTLPSQQQRGFHIGLGLGILFLLFPGKTSPKQKSTSVHLFYGLLGGIDVWLFLRGEISWLVALVFAGCLLLFWWGRRRDTMHTSIPWSDVTLALLALVAGFYHVMNYQELAARTGAYIQQDIAVACLGVLLVLEAARRIVGTPIVIVASLALVYAYAGPYMPGLFSHRGFAVERILTHSFLSTEGILGIPIGISATFIYLFLFFGVVLNRTGIGQFFNDLAFSLTGGLVGGPAKAAVISSALQGTVSGSSVANTVGSGVFTIPLMRKTGYKPEFAAAVEASASTGGQLMPPIMGAAAFLMIEFTGMPYSQIALAALIPAILYFTGIYVAIHLESKRMGIMGLPREQLPRMRELLRKKGYLFLPLLVIIIILGTGQTPMKAAMMGIGTAFLVSFFHRDTRLGIRDVLNILEEGARTALAVIAACAAAGIIVGVVTLTGLGLKAAAGIIALAGGVLILTMLLTMVTSLILGMGLPTTANYVITATMAAPALQELGVPVIAAHMFVFYFGIVADITPPVALAAYAGAGLANANPFRTGVLATKIGVAAFLVPYIFVLSPELVLVDSTVISAALAICTAIIGMIGVSAGLFGYLAAPSTVPERIICFLGGVCLVYPGWISDVLGMGVLLTIWLLQKRRAGAEKQQIAGVSEG
ncbi:TRAP transporter permease [Brevibacillus ruminantium]|uniref:TRAP transporter permease n=1 Tax=Brevibacillus ruminantium TaxID=2950604 RepID=A0ABY4WIL4_9BACL|nr:TRAP transporter permease [Brevibacillus ruminantium]USG66957.1 TRAP transporter permease [Brevibacillus ruminantium]